LIGKILRRIGRIQQQVLIKIGVVQIETRTIDRLREHYETEKLLAKKLRNSTEQQRKYLYATLYDELFASVPDHPCLTRKISRDRERSISAEMKLLKPFLRKNIVFTEIGPGDCALCFEVATCVKRAIGIDVSRVVAKSDRQPANCELLFVEDGTSIPLAPATVHVAYSNQVMEHLHPDDAKNQLTNICSALVPRGIYICITPNRLIGPHDISRFFEDHATGFHLKEYTYRELRSVFGAAGFSGLEALLGYGRVYLRIPLAPLILLETMLSRLPSSVLKDIRESMLLRLLLRGAVIATK